MLFLDNWSFGNSLGQNRYGELCLKTKSGKLFWWSFCLHIGIEVQKSAPPTLFHFARVRAGSQPHVVVRTAAAAAVLCFASSSFRTLLCVKSVRVLAWGSVCNTFEVLATNFLALLCRRKVVQVASMTTICKFFADPPVLVIIKTCFNLCIGWGGGRIRRTRCSFL